jgi:hypothetical protein
MSRRPGGPHQLFDDVASSGAALRLGASPLAHDRGCIAGAKLHGRASRAELSRRTRAGQLAPQFGNCQRTVCTL